jgi:rhodanese-related sulfurtransferase
MNKYILTPLFWIVSIAAIAQDFKQDNVRYETISWVEFFNRLEKNPKLIYFDIRTPGERNDTSEYYSYNQGKIKGAIETDFFDFPSSYPHYLKHKNDTVYLYCSHSRRSRLLAKQLADSSFANIVNINGGLSHLNCLSAKEVPLKSKYYTNSLKYTLASPFEFLKALNNKKYQVIDVRPDSLYYGTSQDEWQNSLGYIESVLHIPYDKVKDNLNLLNKNKIILLFDGDGELSPIAANYLSDSGYKTSILLFGLDNFVSYIPSTERKFLKSKYQIILPSELLKLSQNKNTVLIDVRTESEYTSTDTADWRNVGRLKNAINIPLSKLSKEKVSSYEGKKIILYDIMMHEELYEFAIQLKEYGYNDFYLLAGGIIQLKWEIYNLQKMELKKLIDE